ncbi:MAG: plasmid replication/partition related protein [Comamonas sp.]
MDIVINEELKAYIDPLTPEEHDALERSILAEGCRDALVLWGDVLVDGHNRYGICKKHGLPFQTVQNTRFQSMEDVHLWMIDQHLGRRSVSDFQRGVLALRKREILHERRNRTIQATAAAVPQVTQFAQTAPGEHTAEGDVLPWEDAPTAGPATATADATGAPEGKTAPADLAQTPAERFASREELARAARLSPSQVVLIEKIQKQAVPELVAAIKSGDISLNAAAVVATLPADEQAAAALAGKDELKSVVKRVRDAKRKPREDQPEATGATPAEAQALRQRIAELTEENEGLRLQVAQLQQALRAHGA